jgi:outer membrane protein with beta-barrel domain
MMKRILFFGALALCAVASSAEAQRSSRRGSTSVELGIDGGVMFGLDDPATTVISLPVQDFRVGFLVSPTWELEPRFNLTSIHGGGISATSYSFEAGVLYQPGGDRVGKGLYGRPFLGFTGVSASGSGVSGSTNNGFGGVGVGLKLPWNDRRLATRMEANYTHGFGDGGGNAIGVLIGLSFFTR